MFKVLDIFRKSKSVDQVSAEKRFLLHKYDHFKSVLTGNNRALEIITDLEHLFYGDQSFSLSYIQEQARVLVGVVCQIAEDLNALAGGKYPDLFEAVERVGSGIFAEMVQEKKIAPTPLVFPLARIDKDKIAAVGGKAANLGEIRNRVKLPVPEGFAVSAYACQVFLEQDGLDLWIDRRLKDLNVDDTEKLLRTSEEIKARLLRTTLPPQLEQEIVAADEDLERQFGAGVRLAVRSSATSEDSEASFAGQHSTVLNVTRDNLLHAYKEVVASTYNPRAIFYRRSKGYTERDVVMSVACIRMIEAQASGVMYTVDPNDRDHAVFMISALWGLGLNAVDGSQATDFYQVEKQKRRIEIKETASKQVWLRSAPGAGLQEGLVPDDLVDRPCLTDSQIQLLVHYGFKLEDHYRIPLDIEWAMDQRGKIFVLQARPLGFTLPAGSPAEAASTAEIVGYPVVLQGGAAAAYGVASGLAYVLKSDHNLQNVPEGAILIAPQTSPRYVPIIRRVRGIITDVGSVTGHMASVAREFQVPTLVGTGQATSLIPHGQEITLDVQNRIVYQGRVAELIQEKQPLNALQGSTTYQVMAGMLKKIAPLNLVDPQQENFNPRGCETIHDIIRFAHEMAMQEMFQIGEDLDPEAKVAIRLRTRLPLNLYLIDLGGGVNAAPGAREATLEQVTSIPFQALLQGMTHEGVEWLGQNKIDWGGFASILMESILRDPQQQGAMGGASYAVVSAKYLNFSSRLGYHFATVDTYCGRNINNNYITFYFTGGAADIDRRSRRARLIAAILKRLGFKVDQKGDLVRAQIKKHDQELIREKLDFLGRMMGSVRLLDMILSDEQRIDWFVEEFFKGNYTFQPPEAKPASLPEETRNPKH
ncbi:MAG: pyruvate, phosphate dikinase [Deltaproteobacteria bacterium]|nr:pyruvate, phosphate dikinase [Deltaproteobacteria bacterium]